VGVLERWFPMVLLRSRLDAKKMAGNLREHTRVALSRRARVAFDTLNETHGRANAR